VRAYFASSVFALFALAAFVVMTPESFADSTTVTPLSNEISIETVTTTMNIPKDNTLPWGAVSGNVDDPAPGYPVILMFFKEGDPVHVAQVDVQEDKSYEYKFRVRNVDGDNVVNVFEGDYKVKIFKIVNTPQDGIGTV
jgi:hypothetical protein